MATIKRARKRPHVDDRIAKHLLVMLSAALLIYLVILFWYVTI